MSKFKNCMLTLKQKSLTCVTKRTGEKNQIWKLIKSSSQVKIQSMSSGLYLNNMGKLQTSGSGKGKKSTKFLFDKGALVAGNKKLFTVSKKGKRIVLKMAKGKKKKGSWIPNQIWEFKKSV